MTEPKRKQTPIDSIFTPLYTADMAREDVRQLQLAYPGNERIHNLLTDAKTDADVKRKGRMAKHALIKSQTPNASPSVTQIDINALLEEQGPNDESLGDCSV